MGTRYRVIVEAIDDVEGAQYETTETILFETVSPSALALLRYAPTEVDAALREAAGIDEFGSVPQRVMFGVDVAPAGLVATVFDKQGAVIGAVAEGDTTVAVPAAAVEPVAEPVKPKRTRRSPAQKAADDAAAKLAADASATAQVGEAADTVVEQVQAARWPSAEQVAANVKALDTVDAPEPAPAAPAYAPFGDPAPGHTPAPTGQGVSEPTGQFRNPFLDKA